MVNCPACEAELDVDEDQIEEGTVLNCHECGADYEIVNAHPLELERIGDDEDEDDDEDGFEDDDEDDEDDEDEDEDDDLDDEDDDSELEARRRR